MIAHSTTTQENRQLGELAPVLVGWTRGISVVALGSAVLAAVLSERLRGRFFEAYLVNFAYFLSLALGALFFVILQHLTRSGWSVVLRRLAEAVAVSVLPLAIMFCPVIVGMHHVYHWTHTEAVAEDHLLQWKQPYLNTVFFVARWVCYFAVWAGLSGYYFRRSVEQDTSGDPALTLRMERLAGPAMLVFALTITFAAFDLLMSTDPHWFSTIYGVYYFAGSAAGILALLPVLLFLLQRAGRITQSVTPEHYHDLGKLLFGFVVFWAYIAFSQYMLIWYANIPEETGWYLRRQSGPWTSISLLLLFGHFFAPFLALISRHPKRRKGVLVAAAVWILIMHWIDIYWLVRPEAGAEHVWPHWLDGLCFIGLGALFIAGVVRGLGQGSLIPQRDPRLAESLAFQNT